MLKYLLSILILQFSAVGFSCPEDSTKIEYSPSFSDENHLFCQKLRNGTLVKHGPYLITNKLGKTISMNKYVNGKRLALITESKEIEARSKKMFFNDRDNSDKSFTYYALKFSQDGAFILSAANDGIIQVHSLKTGKLIRSIKVKFPVFALSTSLDGKKLALGSLGVVYLYSMQTGEMISKVSAGESQKNKSFVGFLNFIEDDLIASFRGYNCVLPHGKAQGIHCYNSRNIQFGLNKKSSQVIYSSFRQRKIVFSKIGSPMKTFFDIPEGSSFSGIDYRGDYVILNNTKVRNQVILYNINNKKRLRSFTGKSPLSLLFSECRHEFLKIDRLDSTLEKLNVEIFDIEAMKIRKKVELRNSLVGGRFALSCSGKYIAHINKEKVIEVISL